MRRTLIGLTAAGLLLVSACSDSDSGGPDDADSASEDAANESEGGGGETPEGFCADFQALSDQFGNDPEADPNEVVEALEGLDPPEEIAEDFDAVVEVTRQTAELDTSDPEAMEQAQELSDQSMEAQERVSTYLQDECNLGAESGG
jgi:hypothetical protein